MSDATSATGAANDLIDAHRKWVLEIADALGLTPTQVARKAGLTATTLTRLVNDPDHPHALSSTSIDKIVRTFTVAPPVTPDFGAFRQAIAQAVAALHRQSALQAARPDVVAATVLDLADWLVTAGTKSPEQFEAVASFEAERLKRQRST